MFLLFLFLLLTVVHLVLQTLRSHFVRVGTALHAERLRMLEQLNQARVKNLRIQAILQFRENQ